MLRTTGPGADLSARALLDLISGYLPGSGPGLPPPSLALGSVAERSVGIGGRTGAERRDGFDAVELKGVRLDAGIRITLWGSAAAAAEQAAAQLGLRLLGARDALRAGGVLRLDLTDHAVPVQTPGTGWSATQAYRVLFESEYEDADGAVGLIARIPIALERDREGGPGGESTEVTDAMARWDIMGAAPLVLRGPRTVSGLATLHYWSKAGPIGAVRIVRTTDPSPTTPPTTFTDLTAFLDAVTGAVPPLRNAVLDLASIDALLAELDADPDPIELGDLEPDGVGDAYEARGIAIDPALELPEPTDVLRIEHADAAGLDALAVIYLRTLPPGG